MTRRWLSHCGSRHSTGSPWGAGSFLWGMYVSFALFELSNHTRTLALVQPRLSIHHPGPTKARWGSGLQKWVTDRLITRIVDSLQIHVREVHVRYEVPFNRCAEVFLILSLVPGAFEPGGRFRLPAFFTFKSCRLSLFPKLPTPTQLHLDADRPLL